MNGEQDSFGWYKKTAEENYKEIMLSRFDSEVISQLKKRRYDLKRTQEWTNERLGVADRLLNKWECGLRLPSSFNLFCWADTLDVDIVFVPREKKYVLVDEEEDNGEQEQE